MALTKLTDKIKAAQQHGSASSEDLDQWLKDAMTLETIVNMLSGMMSNLEARLKELGETERAQNHKQFREIIERETGLE